MVLEPLSAFSVACNTLQVLDFGSKVLNRAVEYTRSSDGLLKEQQGLRDVALSLQNLNIELQASLPSNSGLQASQSELRLAEAITECLRLSTDFVKFLDQLKVRNRSAPVDVLRKSFKSLWHRTALNGMERTLSQARDNLNIAFLVFMQSQQATVVGQSDILKSNKGLEASVLEAVKASTASMQDDIKLLADQMNGLNLNSLQKTVSDFHSSHYDLLRSMAERLDSIFEGDHTNKILAVQQMTETVSQVIIDSLCFPQMQDRQEQIHEAHQGTYRWILQPGMPEQSGWDNFSMWLGSRDNQKRIYWIHGKPGSGKSTLMRFLDENINFDNLTMFWCLGENVFRAKHFFWNPGSLMQRSLRGLWQSLIKQLFNQVPDSIPHLVSTEKWRRARTSGLQNADWSNIELKEIIRQCVLRLSDFGRIFLLIDGLDEFEGDDEEREGLITFLFQITKLGNVKICLSSRPWNIFQDAFEDCPSLRLEGRTMHDIESFVLDQLHSCKLFRQLKHKDEANAEHLIKEIVQKANGVFLWVRLVVRELITGLRDGDIRHLRQNLSKIPTDINPYFRKLVESISPQHRREASAILQVLLNWRHDFYEVHAFRLLHLIFIEEHSAWFALQEDYDFMSLDFSDSKSIQDRIESTIRRVNSRCMGLLECFHGNIESSYEFDENQAIFFNRAAGMKSSEETAMANSALLNHIFGQTGGFLHRSLRDFLCTPEAQGLLHWYTSGPYDARIYICNTGIAELAALETLGMASNQATPIASGLLCRLFVLEATMPSQVLDLAAASLPLIERMAHSDLFIMSDVYNYYVAPSLDSWKGQQSTVMTLAIDFRLESFVKLHLKTEDIKEKRGRPILDYILRPRFATKEDFVPIGNSMPNCNLLLLALRLGADPNEVYGSASVWAHFLCLVRDYLSSQPRNLASNRACDEAIEIMINHGANDVLPEAWISQSCHYQRYNEYLDCDDENPDFRFSRRWPNISPISQESDGLHFAVSDLLDIIRGRPRDDREYF